MPFSGAMLKFRGCKWLEMVISPSIFSMGNRHPTDKNHFEKTNVSDTRLLSVFCLAGSNSYSDMFPVVGVGT